MNKQQMEISFVEQGNYPRSKSSTARQRRRERARWWFNRMRGVVNQALDWKSAPPARPQQIYLSIARAK